MKPTKALVMISATVALAATGVWADGLGLPAGRWNAIITVTEFKESGTVDKIVQDKFTSMDLMDAACSNADTLMRDLHCERLQLDEIWQYVRKHQGRLTEDDDATQMGDFYTFVALDADTKLVPTFRVGKRDAYNMICFVEEVRIVTVLGVPPVDSPLKAVQASILSDIK